MQNKIRENWHAIAAGIIILLIPCVLGAGILIGGRSYTLTSFIIVLLAMLPFFLLFEHRAPKAREIVPIAVMAALAAAGRFAFVLLPQFKPIVAIIIITALSFGAEAGFMTGAVAVLASNFFLGQGPWTPWQMFCCGLIGLIAGFLRKKGLLKSKAAICVFGVLSAYFYGMVVDIWTATSLTSSFSLQSLLAVYAAGFWFDTILAGATAFFLFVIEKPLVAKLDRMKLKYGLLEDR